jgi:LysM repeat protein
MADITEIAVAAWRLEKWLDNVNVERKMAAKSALRAIKKYLSENSIEVIDLTGSKFDVGLAVSVVNNESDETDEDKLIISEMVKPIIKENGAVIQYGQVILGDAVKKPKDNNVIETPPAVATEAEKLIAEVAASVSDTLDESDDTTHIDKQENDAGKKSPSKLMVCIAVLQVIIVMAMFAMFVRVGNLTTINNQLLDATKDKGTVSYNTSETVDVSKIENSLTNIEGRLDSVEENIAGLLEKYKATEDEPVAEDQYIVYIVQNGDTLFKICQEHNIDFYANRAIIMRMNCMDDANVIEVGQKLLLPKG